MKTNIWQVTGDNGEEYEDNDHWSVVVEALTNEEAVAKGTQLLAEQGFRYDIIANLVFKDVTMKKPIVPKPKCKHCGKADPV